MNYPVWPDSGVGYPRTLLNSGGMRSLPPPPPPPTADDKCGGGGGGGGSGGGSGGGAKYANGDGRSGGTGASRLNEECGAGGGGGGGGGGSGAGGGGGGGSGGGGGGGGGPRGPQGPSNYNDDDSLLKVATHFLSSNSQGRHYVPIARDYSSLGYSGVPSTTAYCPSQQG